MSAIVILASCSVLLLRICWQIAKTSSKTFAIFTFKKQLARWAYVAFYTNINVNQMKGRKKRCASTASYNILGNTQILKLKALLTQYSTYNVHMNVCVRITSIPFTVFRLVFEEVKSFQSNVQKYILFCWKCVRLCNIPTTYLPVHVYRTTRSRYLSYMYVYPIIFKYFPLGSFIHSHSFSFFLLRHDIDAPNHSKIRYTWEMKTWFLSFENNFVNTSFLSQIYNNWSDELRNVNKSLSLSLSVFEKLNFSAFFLE